MPLPATVLGRRFDYIIVGGGPAGLTAAQRIAEDDDLNVLLLEAGSDFREDPMILRLGQHGAHLGDPAYDWGYLTEPQPGLNGRQVLWSRGKGLGGSTAINFMSWTVPDQNDVDDWERLGNQGWNFERLIKSIHHDVNFTSAGRQPDDFDPTGLPKGGKREVSWPKVVTDSELKFRQTLIGAGIPHSKRPVGGELRGIVYFPSSFKPDTNERTHAGQIYSDHYTMRKNLTVLKNALVTRLIFADHENDSDDWNVNRVQFTHDGETVEVEVQHEVILSAGTLETPHILELSGIGRPRVLDPLQIPVKIDLPVGENVQEHMILSIVWELKDDNSLTSNVLRDGPQAVEEHLKLYTQDEGAFLLNISTFAFLSLNEVSPEKAALISSEATQHIMTYLEEKDLEPGVRTSLTSQLERLQREPSDCQICFFPGYIGPPINGIPAKGKKYVSVACFANHLWSRGTIHAKSSDPLVSPTFDPKYFSEQSDVASFVELVKYVRALADKEPFKSLLADNAEVIPGPSIQTEEQISNWVKQSVQSVYHPLVLPLSFLNLMT